VSGWTLTHAGRRSPALSGVDLRIEEGERVLLLGASGAGKSTLLKAIAGLVDASAHVAGSLSVLGHAPRPGDGVSALVSQDPENQLVMARAGDDVAFGLENLRVPAAEIWPRVESALSSMGLAGLASADTHRLSGGQQQRLVLAGALAMRPRLLLLDEPTALLDPAGGDDVRRHVARAITPSSADPPITLVLVEHRVAEWLPLLDRVVVLEAGGGVVADGTPDEVFTRHLDLLTRLGVWVPGAPPGPSSTAGTGGDEVLAAEHLSLRYPDAQRDAVADASVVVRAGDATGIIGANGSGKSTLGRLLAGLVSPTSGAVMAPGQPKPLHTWRSGPLSRHVSMVFQNPEHQFLARTVAAELRVRADTPPSARRPTWRRAEVDGLLDRLRLDHLADADPFTLSGGEQRRLSVATALASGPRAIVLDEPTYGQDRRTWTELVTLLSGIRDEGVAVSFISHDRDLLRALADRAFTMTAGVLSVATP
jgi:energy-coupling factor transport system ATP-binding protein